MLFPKGFEASYMKHIQLSMKLTTMILEADCVDAQTCY